jgi:hypothetical protein
VVYQISQDESQVRFNIYEQLRGQPKDVIGVSNQVAGQAAVDLNDLSTAQLGEIVINARTLETDDSRRNQAIRNRILFIDQYEFVTTPHPDQRSERQIRGGSFTFQVTGDLTIKDVTAGDVRCNRRGERRLTGWLVRRNDDRPGGLRCGRPACRLPPTWGETMALEIDFVLAPQP